jgi:hypothetical protein
MDFSGLSLPFSVSDLISSGSGLLSIIGPIVLAALTFHFSPLIIALIFKAFGKEREYKEQLVFQRKHNKFKYFNMK